MSSESRKQANKKYYEKRKLKLREESLKQDSECDIEAAICEPQCDNDSNDSEKTYTFTESELQAILRQNSKSQK